MDSRGICPLYQSGHCPHGSECPFRHDLEAVSVRLCIFEQKGPGKCPHGSQCPRSHDPRLLGRFWPAPLLPVAPPVALPAAGQTDQGPVPHSVPSFLYNAHFLEDETQVTEFKACSPQSFETQIAVHMLSKYICAFLNTIGGVLYYGITDDHVVKGLILTSAQRDKLRLGLDTCCNAFHPEVDAEKVTIRFEKVLYPDGSERKDAFVVVIRVDKGDPGVIYFTPDHKAWIKRQASIRELKSTALVAFIRKKLEGKEDFDEEIKANVPDRKYPLWEYYCHVQGCWVEYPEDLQTVLETAFHRENVNSQLHWRGEESSLDFQRFRETSSCQSWECRRLDWRRLGQGIWHTIWNNNWHRFDPVCCQKLDRDFAAEKPESEVSIEDFIFYTSFERMRLTGEMPLWRMTIV